MNILRQGKKFSMLVRRADEARDQKRWSEAAQLYGEALECNPDAAAILIQHGHMLKESGSFDEALVSYNRALELQPDDADLHLQIGHLYNKFGYPPQADQWYERAKQMTVESHENAPAGTTAIATASQSSAEVGLRRVVEAAAASLDLRKVVPELKKLIDDHGAIDAVPLLGHAFKESGQFDEAREEYFRYQKHAIETADHHCYEDALISLAHLAKVEGDYAAALTCFAEAKESKERRSGTLLPSDELLDEIRTCIKQTAPSLA